MARARWPLVRARPVIEVVLAAAQGGQKVTRTLLADTGAGNGQAAFEFLLDENDCIAGFRFLNRFTYGNFGNPNEFGLET